MKQILLENAYEAWKNAISYHDKKSIPNSV